MAELRGIEYLRSKLECKRPRVLTRYNYYEMKNTIRDFGISSPPSLRWFQDALGWCAKSVDSIADRLTIREFVNDTFDFQKIFDMNNPDVFFDSVINGALVASCSFVYISKDAGGFPRLQSIAGYDATGIIDPITNLLTEGYAVLQRDADNDEPIVEAYFEPYKTTIIYATGETEEYDTGIAYPALVPVIYKPDAKRPFGHSRISRACMDIQDSAVRTIKRSEIGAEFYSYPQKYVTGLSEDVEIDKWKATMSSLLTFSKDEDGDHPIMGQFQTQSMTPHLEQLRMFASLFGAETGLTLDDLGFASGNPASYDAIKAQHENLRLAAKKAQNHFGRSFLNVGMVSACVRDNATYTRDKMYETRLAWEPVFEPDGSALSGIGDAMIKLTQAFPDYMTEDKLKDLTGL